MTYIHQSGLACAECGIYVRPGDGGIRVFGRLFCSDLCADCQDPAFSDPPEDADRFDVEEVGW